MSEFKFHGFAGDNAIPATEVQSMVRNRYPERCTGCQDWVHPTWTVTWPDGRTEVRCGTHGGVDR